MKKITELDKILASKEDERIDVLNMIYQPLVRKATDVKNTLLKLGFNSVLGFYNYHNLRQKNETDSNFYPIPIVSIASHIQICFEAESTFVEYLIAREKALKINYSDLTKKYDIELYGSNDHLLAFYNKFTDVSKTLDKIALSSEEKLVLTFFLNKFSSDEKIIEIVNLLCREAV